MMQQTEMLSKILNIREQEKKDAQIAHHTSMTFFDRVASKLSTLTNEKAKAEKAYQEYLAEMTTIEKIREQTAYIEKINMQIVTMQAEAKKAREKMEAKQAILTDAHIEVKKFEKIIDNREHEQLQLAERAEQMMMDEISTKQYLSQRSGE